MDPHADAILATIGHVLEGVAQLEPCADFGAARARLVTDAPDLLVTNLRLHAYNGLHLVLLAASTSTRCLVYAEPDDLMLAREAQRLGAFYERLSRLPFALPAFIKAMLPERDRRDAAVLDRRFAFRGGRRATDLSHLPGVLQSWLVPLAFGLLALS